MDKELPPFPLILPDGCTYAPMIHTQQQIYSDITHQPLPHEFNHIPSIAYEKLSQQPTVTKDSVQTSHIAPRDLDYMMLWNGFVNEFPSLISPGQTFDACIAFIQTFRQLILREPLSFHLLSLAQLKRLSSYQIIQLLHIYDKNTSYKKFYPQSVVQILNEKGVSNSIVNQK